MNSIPASFPVEGIQADEKSFTIRISSTSLSCFDSFIAGLPNLAKTKTLGINKIEIGSFAERGNNYLLTFNVFYKQKGGIN